MKPSIKLHRVYKNGTTFSVLNDSVDGNPNPDLVMFEIGLLKQQLTPIVLGYGDTPTIAEFMDKGVPFYINSYTLGETTDVDEPLRVLGSGVIQFVFHAFYDSGYELTVEPNGRYFTTEYNLMNDLFSSETIRVGSVIYNIDKRALTPNKIYVKEAITQKGKHSFMLGNVATNYIVSRGKIEDKIEQIYLSLKTDILDDKDVCCNPELEKRFELLRNMKLLLEAVEYHCKRQDFISIASILETLERTLVDKFKAYV